MERFFNLNQINVQNNIIEKRKPTIRILVQIDENHLENNVISFKDLFQNSTYIHKKNSNKNKSIKQENFGKSHNISPENKIGNSVSISNSNNEINNYNKCPTDTSINIENNIIQTFENKKNKLNANSLIPKKNQYKINNLNLFIESEERIDYNNEIINIEKYNNDEDEEDDDVLKGIRKFKQKKRISNIEETHEKDEKNTEEIKPLEYEKLKQQENKDEYINEIENIIINNKPLDIKRALYLREIIEKEKYTELKKQMSNWKKRKFYEYDKNDPFIDDSEDYIIYNSSKLQKIEKQNFVVWSGIYGKHKRKRNTKIKPLENDIKVSKNENNKVNKIELLQIPSTLYPLDPKLEIHMKQLKNQSDKCNWNSFESLPETLLPVLKKVLKLADKYNQLNMNFYGHLRLILKNKFNEDINYLKNFIEKVVLEEKILNLTNEQRMHIQALKKIIDQYRINIVS
ncbi:hypothetical protein BCR36DRAFT_409882 [Piromyces finnis]|uniref:Hpc2-related domain-containing protein n=1 Tax=Piromyces finnis TaxID=1754191 RepID=A0A1Y1VJ53_9FUNG|nr:hypothetical protein BCR36DRAFT_409882 [Piromyces finnis]|eukprot:ORX56698.1 hypothetical protein BCR36DRAFT_409882 [Piromyces finnis]